MPGVASFEVTLQDRSTEIIDDADAYQQEGPMTTFFVFGAGREIVDSWASRVASIRTSDILLIRSVRAEVASETSPDPSALRVAG